MRVPVVCRVYAVWLALVEAALLVYVLWSGGRPWVLLTLLLLVLAGAVLLACDIVEGRVLVLVAGVMQLLRQILGVVFGFLGGVLGVIHPRDKSPKELLLSVVLYLFAFFSVLAAPSALLGWRRRLPQPQGQAGAAPSLPESEDRGPGRGP